MGKPRNFVLHGNGMAYPPSQQWLCLFYNQCLPLHRQFYRNIYKYILWCRLTSDGKLTWSLTPAEGVDCPDCVCAIIFSLLYSVHLQSVTLTFKPRTWYNNSFITSFMLYRCDKHEKSKFNSNMQVPSVCLGLTTRPLFNLSFGFSI